ncbi:MAG: Glu-tRNA(Gln) amidotransferase subunit GatE [Candidatus Njordarchaeales archaeon]
MAAEGVESDFYREVGLKVGLEIHQQLKTSRKLFCYCPPILRRDDPDIRVIRFMRPTLGETGEIDPTMQKEFKKRKTIIYEAYKDTTCLYELDEIPPYEISQEALEIALMIALLFNMKIPDILLVSRKQYLDGSVPSGFQRTVIVGLDGYVELSNGKRLRILQLCLEEDAARKIAENDKETVYRVDRLGIPLVEITTDASLSSPEEVLDAALRIGALLRATKKVLRGIGTIRQDINVSIKGGNRVEIKGVQRPEWFKSLIDNEIKRQLALIKIAEELKARGVTKESIEKEPIIDVTDIFMGTEAKFISRAIKRGEKVFAIKLPNFGGLLGREILPGKRFGKEFAERVSVITGLKGIIHTDELPAYGISKEEKEKLFEVLKADRERDCIVIVVGPEKKAIEALEEVRERAKEALDGVPTETRKANPDGTTSFERPLGGAARLYPDTDSPPIVLNRSIIERIMKSLPEYPWKRVERYMKEYGLSKEYAERIVLSERSEVFEEIVRIGVPPKLVATVILETMTSLRREGFLVDRIPDEKLVQVFIYYKKGELSKEALPEVLKELSKNPEREISDILKELGIKKISLEELDKIIEKIIRNNIELVKKRRERAFKPLMGDVMKIVRGKIDGKTVSERLREKLQQVIKELNQ